MKKVLITLEVLFIIVAGGVIAFIYSGVYDIAATSPHFVVTEWILSTTMDNSVRHHAQGIAVPNLAALDREKGLKHYHQMCVLCHGAPGVKRSVIGKGQLPEPPDLGKAVNDWTPAELFWIVKHGVKMTGMPAFGPSAKDEDLWTLVAFIRELPKISPAQYQEMTKDLPPGPAQELPQPSGGSEQGGAPGAGQRETEQGPGQGEGEHGAHP